MEEYQKALSETWNQIPCGKYSSHIASRVLGLLQVSITKRGEYLQALEDAMLAQTMDLQDYLLIMCVVAYYDFAYCDIAKRELETYNVA